VSCTKDTDAHKTLIKGHYADHLLVAAYWSQLKARTQVDAESLLEFAVVTEQLAHRAFVGLLKTSSKRKEPMRSLME
jgi:hypothetical protein